MDALSLIAAHMLGDFVFQTSKMAAHKLHDPRVRAEHVAVYTACFSPGALLDLSLPRALAFLLLVYVTHFVLDSRRWADGKDWAPRPILVDQALHLTTLAVLMRLFH